MVEDILTARRDSQGPVQGARPRRGDDHLPTEQVAPEPREQVAREIERFVRTPPGVAPSDVTKAYLHAAHVARTGHAHDAWTECPDQTPPP